MSSKLTRAQHAILTHALAQTQGKVLWFPETLKGGARIKVLTSMHNAALIEPGIAEPEVYVATATGLQAIGITVQAPRAKREGTKQAVLIELLTRAEGATLPQMTEATGWQVHYADVLVMPTNVGNPAYVAEIAALGSA